jgi:predicted metal-dependent phosphoesterase TrpH
MTPRRIIEKAAGMGLDIIALSDHNSAENLVPAMKIASERGIALLPSMEITSSEEAHVLAIFENMEGAMYMQETVYENLTEGVNDERLWGLQIIVNEQDEVLGFNKRLLIGSTRISLGDLIERIHGIGGLAVASHVDREHFSVISQLGFIPEDAGFDAIEIANTEKAGAIIERYPDIPRLYSSDAHRLEDIGKKTTAFLLGEASFREISMALRKLNGRAVVEN